PDSNTYTVSPKGDKLAFTLRPQREGFVWSTDVDIYIVDTDPNRGPEQPVLITGAYDGTASNPAFSGDGTKLAWLQMETPKYEADINRIHVFDVMEGRELPLSLARDWDQSPSDLTWSWDDRVLYATVDIKGSTQIFAIDIAEGRRTDITSEYGYGIVEVPQPISASELLVYAGDLDKPGNAFVIPSTYSRGGGGGSGPPPTPRQLTDVNGDKLRGVYLDKAHDFWFKGARGDLVHGWYLLPYGFDAAKKWPLAMIVHGGPQQNNDKAFSYAQWNENMYANAGFFTVLINFHGSPSYGQDFTNSINNQWGGYPYEDLILGLDYLLDQFDFIDSNRMVSLGASYGGYMQNWLNGHTDRFQCLVNHDGEFDLTSSYYSTDELWFPEYDLDGVPFRGAESLKPLYRERYSDGYKRWSPSEYADQMKTPTLFIHGQNDFRLSLSQSIMPFTLLRRKGIQARLMYFPDEDHWTNRKANSIRWFTEVMRWISGCTNTSLPYELPQLL
ncbi:dipeptidylpeptidase, partial [Spiromyces aspiralis]